MSRVEPGGTEKAKRYRYLICLVIFLGYILVFFHRLCPAVIALDMQEAFNATGTLLGVLGSAYFYIYAIMQLPAGLLADSWGPRKTVASFFLVAAAGSVLMGAAPTLGLAILGRVLVGFGVSTLFVCNFKLLSEWFDQREFVIMGGIFMAMGGIGVLSSSAPLAWVSDLIGWRMTLVAVGIITLIMAALLYVFVRNRPQDKGWPPLYTSEKWQQSTKIGLLQGVKQVVTAGRFWPLATWCFFALGIFFALAGLWAGPYLIHVYGLSKAAAGGVLSMFAVALIIGSPILSLVSNYSGRKPVFIGCSLVLLTVCGLLYVFPGRLPVSMLYVLFFFLSLSGTGIGPLTATVSKELFPLSIAGTAVGTMNFFPFFGGALFQVIMGAIVSYGGHVQGIYSRAGYQHMFLFCVAGAAASLVAAFFLRETLPRIGHTD
jgi:sugar phosphate permease